MCFVIVDNIFQFLKWSDFGLPMTKLIEFQ